MGRGSGDARTPDLLGAVPRGPLAVLLGQRPQSEGCQQHRAPLMASPPDQGGQGGDTGGSRDRAAPSVAPGGGRQLLQKLTVRLGCSPARGAVPIPHSPVGSVPAPSRPTGPFAVNLLPWGPRHRALGGTGRCWGELGEPGPGAAAAADCLQRSHRGAAVRQGCEPRLGGTQPFGFIVVLDTVKSP